MFLICIAGAEAALRDKNTTARGKNTTTTTVEKKSRTTTTNSRNTNTVSTRNAKPVTTSTRTTKTVSTRTPINNTVRSTTNRNLPQKKNIVTRAATNTTSESQQPIETRTGAEYEKCKVAFFTCMDQFCELKNDSFRRCSCSDRVYDFQDITEVYQSATERLTEFSENLDVVGLTKEQATAMKTASEGEDALTEDKSASKQLLQAIMNAIRGDDASVGGKYKDLNSVSITTDITNAFGLDDMGQIVSSYNGTTLYKAVYPKCKQIVQPDCNNASLQRAINAYLMAIEQDCNTVETALQSQQKTLKAATHESSAMLDLARIENRRNHNSDDIATCIANIEAAIKSDEVCGSDYHKCLDNGQFIDVTTGAPLTGVVDFYKLGQILTYRTSENLQNQKLSTISNNRPFVQFFENKTKKFAQSSLDKCSEKADEAWREYLDMALIDIYYAQQSKVDEIQQNCFDLITGCYTNQTGAIASAMAALTGDKSLLLKPATIDLTSQMCSDYIQSCNNMFDGNVVAAYTSNKDLTDTETACRAIAQQCFDNFGGTGYENFYYLQSGLFVAGEAIDWFTLYDTDRNIISPCAQELVATEGCQNQNLLERVFGGFNKRLDDNNKIIYTTDEGTNPTDRKIRPRGVATEVYAKIVDNLATQCEGINGYFVEHQFAEPYGYNANNFCELDTTSTTSIFFINSVYESFRTLNYWYNFIENENICPLNYAAKIDVQSWGACSCWENGGYRSKNGTSEICRPLLPIPNTGNTSIEDPTCTDELLPAESNPLSSNTNENQWCQQPIMSSLGQVCPKTHIRNVQSNVLCAANENQKSIIEVVLNLVPQHKMTVTEIADISSTVTENVINVSDIIHVDHNNSAIY